MAEASTSAEGNDEVVTDTSVSWPLNRQGSILTTLSQGHANVCINVSCHQHNTTSQHNITRHEHNDIRQNFLFLLVMLLLSKQALKMQG